MIEFVRFIKIWEYVQNTRIAHFYRIGSGTTTSTSAGEIISISSSDDEEEGLSLQEIRERNLLLAAPSKDCSVPGNQPHSILVFNKPPLPVPSASQSEEPLPLRRPSGRSSEDSTSKSKTKSKAKSKTKSKANSKRRGGTASSDSSYEPTAKEAIELSSDSDSSSDSSSDSNSTGKNVDRVQSLNGDAGALQAGAGVSLPLPQMFLGNAITIGQQSFNALQVRKAMVATETAGGEFGKKGLVNIASGLDPRSISILRINVRLLLDSFKNRKTPEKFEGAVF